MSFELAEELKHEWTDQFVQVDDEVAELKRFAGLTGQVKTVNMSGQVLVEFEGSEDIGWYDIHPRFLKIVASAPVEVMEHAAPFLVTRRELIPGTAGAGQYRGGAGQRISLKLRSNAPATVSTMFERALFPPRGLLGGKNGSPGRLLLDGQAIDPKRGCVLQPGSELVIETAGGGGYGKPRRTR